MKRTLGFLLVFSGLLPIGLSQASTARKDLVVPLGQLFCKGTLSPQELWAAGIFDGQIEGNKVETPSFINLNEDDLWKQAKSLAAVRISGGYAAGLCDQHQGWTAAMPASGPLGLGQKGVLGFPKTELKERCRSWRASFAASEGGVSKVIASSETRVTMPKIEGLPQGVVSLHCTPKFPRWAGEQGWYFYPTRDPQSFVDFPGKASLNQRDIDTVDLQQGLFSWLSGIRLREKLDPLVLSRELSEAASQLLVSDGVDHDVTLMEVVRKKFSTPLLTLEGENRVRGRTLEEIAWLLWNSPRHRDLLLSTVAPDQKSAAIPVVGIASKKVGPEVLISLVIGYQKKMPIGQKSEKFKKKIGS